MIAMALAGRPKLLIADEPTTALDVTIQAQILALLDELQAEMGMALLFITHDLNLVRRFTHRVGVMERGKLVESGPTATMFAAPQHPYTQALLAAVPRLGSPALADLELGDPPDPHHPPQGCHFHPRCPIGPTVVPERQICIEQDPRAGAADRPHHSFCHFASATSSRAAGTSAREEHFHVACDR
jgi:peptide/nickel transport system ATP-binding protein